MSGAPRRRLGKTAPDRANDENLGEPARPQDKPTFLFGHFKYVTTHALSSAVATADQARYPVLLFLEGATGFRQMNAFQVEHLVSHGYIVVAID